MKIDMKKTGYSAQDYEDLLARISAHVKQDDLDLEHIFEHFQKQGGLITYDNLRTILELISFEISEADFNLLTLFADENKSGQILAYDLSQQIIHAEQIAPQFEIYKWIIASRELQGKSNLLEVMVEHMDKVTAAIAEDYAGPNKAHQSKVLTGEQF